MCWHFCVPSLLLSRFGLISSLMTSPAAYTLTSLTPPTGSHSFIKVAPTLASALYRWVICLFYHLNLLDTRSVLTTSFYEMFGYTHKECQTIKLMSDGEIWNLLSSCQARHITLCCKIGGTIYYITDV